MAEVKLLFVLLVCGCKGDLRIRLEGVGAQMERLSGDFSIEEFLSWGDRDVLYRPKIGKLSDPDVNRVLLGEVLTLFAKMDLTIFEALLFLEAAKRNLLLVNRVSVPQRNEVGMYQFPLD